MACRPRILVLALAAASLPAFPAIQAPGPELADLSLEELSKLEVTTTSLRPERYSKAPASIFVITNEDIRRSGARSLPEALRLAPNLDVAQVSATSYAISARGFQNVITNKLLVLLDGRTLYTTVLSGVLWDAQDVMLEDIDRIEVISGPGAALYGANAFTGVINIISKRADATQGVVASAGGGDYDRQAAARIGGAIGQSGAWRFYGMHIERDDLRPAAAHVADRMIKDQAGFRTDWGPAENGFTFQGDAYSASIDSSSALPVEIGGTNLLGRWTRSFSDDSRLVVQAYYDHTRRNDPATFIDQVDTYDFTVQHNLPAWGRHRISWSAGYRSANDHTSPSAVLRFIPDDKRLHWTSAAAQDEIALGPTLSLIAGARWQTDVYVHPVFLPDVRLAWSPTSNQLAWVSASGVARTPGRIDRDFFIPATAPYVIQGGPSFTSETGRTYEVGYRAQPVPAVTVSVSAFLTNLDDLRGGQLSPDHTGFVIANAVQGRTTGLEAWAMWQANPRWRLMLGWLELHQDLHDKNDNSLSGPAGLGNDPRHTAKVRSSWHVTDTIDLDVDWRYVSSLAYLTTVPAYDATDIHVAWRVSRNIELSLAVNNAFDRRHVEFDEHGFPTEIPRSAYGQLRLYF